MELMLSEIETKIYEIKSVKVMLDSDLAELYQVETKRINEAVKNNLDKFPQEFYFELSNDEVETLRSKNSTFKESLKGRKYLPKVFTEEGVYMLATILKSKVATDLTLHIIKTFSKIREFSLNYKDIVIELKNMQNDIKLNKENISQNSQYVKQAFELLSQILEDTANKDKNLIGFRPHEESS